MPKLPAAAQVPRARYGAWHLVAHAQQQALHYPMEPQWYDALSDVSRSSPTATSTARCGPSARHAGPPRARLEQYGACTPRSSYVDCMNRWQSGDVA